jgi:formylglycine-generating enzyme required for sulfatase activity
MGSPPGEWGRAKYIENQVEVTLTHDILVQQLETTQAEWVAAGLVNPSVQTGDEKLCSDCTQPNCPVGNMTWFEAAYFTNKLSQMDTPPLDPCYELVNCEGEPGDGMVCETASATGNDIYACSGYRLPTEAEWEYFTRAGTKTTFYSGDIKPLSQIDTCGHDPNLEQIAWYCYNETPARESRVGGEKASNGWGLFDTSGNVSEWINDTITGSYPSGPVTDPGKDLELTKSDIGGVRGGFARSWSNMCRSAQRLQVPRVAHGGCFGFRMVRTVP